MSHTADIVSNWLAEYSVFERRGYRFA